MTGIEPLVLALTLGSAVVGGATSLMQASAQNRAIEDQRRLANRNSQVQRRQANQDASLKRIQETRRAAQIRGALRVKAGATGTGVGGSFTRLLYAADSDQALNLQIIEENRVNQIYAINSGLAGTEIGLNSRVENPLLAGLVGGLQLGAQGLSAGQGLSDAFGGSGAGTSTGDAP